MVQGKDDAFADAVSYDGVDVLSVLLPFGLLLVELNSVVDLFQQLVHSSSTVLHVEQLLSDRCLEDVVVLLGGNGLILAIDHWLLQLGEFGVNAVKRFLHLIDDLVQVIDGFLGCRDEVIDSGGLPFELFHSGLNVLVHFDDSLLYQGLLHVVEAGHDSVVVLDDELERHHLATVDVCFLEELRGCLRHISLQLLQVFHLAKELHEDGVEVYLQKSILFVLA